MSADAAASLAARGWAVVDEFFAPEFAEILRDEMVALAAMGKMLPNKTYFANPAGGRFLFSKPHVFEVDLHQVAPFFRGRFQRQATGRCIKL